MKSDKEASDKTATDSNSAQPWKQQQKNRQPFLGHPWIHRSILCVIVKQRYMFHLEDRTLYIMKYTYIQTQLKEQTYPWRFFAWSMGFWKDQKFDSLDCGIYRWTHLTQFYFSAVRMWWALIYFIVDLYSSS